MKNLFTCLLLILALCELTSCKNNLDPLEEGMRRGHTVKDDNVIKRMHLNFGGDYVSESEEPLMRAEDGKTYIGINVFYTKKDDKDGIKYPYAYGLFESTSNISIDLLTGRTYDFEATIFTEREDKLWDSSSTFLGYPFMINNGNGGSGINLATVGDFIYTYNKNSNEQFYFITLKNGTAKVDAGNALPSRYGPVNFPRAKRYYGEIEDFNPSLMTNIDFRMDFKSFGLKFLLESIPGNTSVSVADVSDTGNSQNVTSHPEYYLRFPNGLTLNSSSEASKTWEGIYSLNDLTKDTHEFNLRFTWNKGSGEVETFEHKFTVEAKKKKVLKISIDGDINDTKSGNITFSNINIADTDLEEEYEDVSNVKI